MSPTVRFASRALLSGIALASVGPSHAADEAPVPSASAPSPSEAGAPPSKFRDADDGHFDVSGFLETAHGFVPLLVPITEPALGYGAIGAAVFLYGNPPDQSERFVRPNIAMVGALRTDNGTSGYFGGHLGTWLDGRLRTTVALADVDINLEFFGLGGDRVPGDGVGYSVKGHGGVAGGSYRIGATQLWIGARYVDVRTSVALDPPLQTPPPGMSPADFALHLGALTPSITFDRRDNFLTPTDGWYVDLSVPVYRDSLGSDRNFETLNLTAMYYRPLSASLFLGVRGSVKDSSDGTPFFLLPSVSLRGVQALRYQGQQVDELETEVRWQLNPRYSVLGFVGYGAARSSFARDREQSVTSGGVGFRYLVARRYGLHLGVDVATSAEDTAFYVVFGNAWLRP